MFNRNSQHQKRTADEPREQLTLHDRPRCDSCGCKKTATRIEEPGEATNDPCGCEATVVTNR